MANGDTILRVTLSGEQRDAAQRRAAKAGFESIDAWAQALVEADLRRGALEAHVTNAIEQGDFQQLAADLRDQLRVAPAPKHGKS
jgi:hypothetical protein